MCKSTQLLSLELSYNSRFRFHSTCICINMNILVLHASMDISTSFPHLYKQRTTCFFSLCSDHRCKKHRFCFAGVLFGLRLYHCCSFCICSCMYMILPFPHTGNDFGFAGMTLVLLSLHSCHTNNPFSSLVVRVIL